MINRIPIILIFLSTVIFSQSPDFELNPNSLDDLFEDFIGEVLIEIVEGYDINDEDYSNVTYSYSDVDWIDIEIVVDNNDFQIKLTAIVREVLWY